MRSSLPKVLHPLAGEPMLHYVVAAAREAGIANIVVVVGPDADEVRSAAGDNIAFAVQAKRLGTGHALLQAQEAVGDAERVLVLNGDVPLITGETLQTLAKAHEETTADLTFLTAQVEDAGEYGCVQRDAQGRVG